jgi:hypothetical protein
MSVGESFSTGLYTGLETPLPAPPKSSEGSQNKRKKQQRNYNKAVTKRAKNISEIAREAILFDCKCKVPCLANVGDTITESGDMMAEYMTTWMNMERKEHREKFFGILEGCARGVTSGGHLDKR